VPRSYTRVGRRTEGQARWSSRRCSLFVRTCLETSVSTSCLSIAETTKSVLIKFVFYRLTQNTEWSRVIRVSVLSQYFIKIVKLAFIHPLLTELSYRGLATVNEHPTSHEAQIKLYRLPHQKPVVKNPSANGTRYRNQKDLRPSFQTF